MDKLQTLRTANTITDAVLCDLKSFILREKVLSTEEVAIRAERLMKLMSIGDNTIEPAFKGYKDFPGSICISLNDEVVHGIPSKDKFIRKGDLVSLDLGVRYKGYCSDMAISFVNSAFSFGKKQKLVEDTKQALEDAIKELKKETVYHISSITGAIVKYSKKYGIVFAYGGHQIGKEVHEGSLFIPNTWESLSKDQILPVGTVFTIEPMFTLGKGDVKVEPDGWTVKTQDGSLAAHFEYSLAITENGVEVLK
jgi:methionyl aminopeptidase